MTGRSLNVAIFYFCCSISMNFLNKAVVSSYDFNYPFTIMACQMIVTILFLDTLRHIGKLKLPGYSYREGLDFLSASLCFSMHSTLSLSALHGMNLPMYGAIKRCTPLVSLLLSVIVLRRPYPSALLSLSIGIITLGVLIASLGDLEFDGHAYFLGSLSVFAQAGYLTLVQRSSEFRHKGSLEMIHINAYNSLPVFLTLAILMGEPDKVAESLKTEDTSFYLIFVLLIVSGIVLSYSQFLCAAVCSALTTSIVGVSKSILQTLLGFFTFGGVRFHPLNISGLVLNVLGGVLYAYVKQLENRKAADRSSNSSLYNGSSNSLYNRKNSNHASKADIV